MTTITAGQKTSLTINSGSVVVATASADGAGQIWFTRPGAQDVLFKSIVAGGVYHLGPYGQQADVRIECSGGSIDVQNDFRANPVPFEVARQMGTLTKVIADAAYQLSSADHGYMLKFSQACTVTVPKGLRSDFSCGWSQEAAGVVTFAAASGVTINSKGGGLASSAQYSTGGIAAFDPDVFRLMGV